MKLDEITVSISIDNAEEVKATLDEIKQEITDILNLYTQLSKLVGDLEIKRIVYCKDCIHGNIEQGVAVRCKFNGIIHTLDDYCKCGDKGR